jgi:hypothetical protein
MKISRRVILKSAIAAPFIMRRDPTWAQIFSTLDAVIPSFPGQKGNPVGYKAEPGWPGSFTGNSGLSLPNPCTMQQLAAHFGGTIPSGTPASPQQFKYFNFIADASGAGTCHVTVDGSCCSSVGLHDVQFIGCQFQGCPTMLADTLLEVYRASPRSTNLLFSYCSIVPVTSGTLPVFSKQTVPILASPAPIPNPTAWPSNSVGTGVGGTPTTYMIPFLTGAGTHCVGADCGTGFLWFDHCDMWGSGSGFQVAQNSGTAGGYILVTDCWIHDLRYTGPPVYDPTYPSYNSVGYGSSNFGAWVWASNSSVYVAQLNTTMGNDPLVNSPAEWVFIQNSGDHHETIGFTNGTLYCQNVIMKHCVFASLGTAYNIAFAPTTVQGYSNLLMDSCYISGCNRGINFGDTSFVGDHMVFTNNIYGTDIQVNNPLYTDFGFRFTSLVNKNIWRGNKLIFYPGDTWSGVWAAWSGGGGGNTYRVGNVVQGSDFNIYVALQDNGPGTAGGSQNPVGNPSFWQLQTPAQIAKGYYLWPVVYGGSSGLILSAIADWVN